MTMYHACFVCKRTHCTSPKSCAMIFMARRDGVEVEELRLEPCDVEDLLGLPVDFNDKGGGFV